jgi:uncharacterized protein YndB with AHSA1/START domain
MSDQQGVPEPIAARTLTLERIIDAPPAKVFEAWTKPELLKQWFAPKPYTTPFAELDVRAGGTNTITMQSPEGQAMPNVGVYLEVVPNRKIVFTDAFDGANWQPKGGAPFMVATITMEEAPGGKTKYTAQVQHWSVAMTKQHEQMGFHTGWGICADQLNELVSKG